MPELFGRQKIFVTDAEITKQNVVETLNFILPYHTKNMLEEEYLYWYRRGVQPILERTKQVRPEICNKIVMNIASEITTFKNGFFLTKPTFYVSRKDSSETNERVKKLNEYLYLSGKHQADNKVVDWFHTVGVGTLYIKPNNDDRIPYKVYSLDPRNSFVAYSHNVGNEPLLAVNMVEIGKENGISKVIFDVITKKKIFKVEGGMRGNIALDIPLVATAIRVISEEENRLGEIPIIEYFCDTNRLGCFEAVISMLDAINVVQSNRLDGIEQFIQALMVFYNCALGEDENGNPITSSYIRDAGAVFLKSVGQDKADLKILSEQLDQTQTQVLMDNMYERVLSICGVPSTTKGGSSTSDTGAAVFLRDGWEQADTYARNTADLFKESNRLFDNVMLKILQMKEGIDLNLDDFDLQFSRDETTNILVKTQAALNLKQLGYSPELAFARSGLSADPGGDVESSRKYIDQMWSAKAEENTKIDLVEETREYGVDI